VYIVKSYSDFGGIQYVRSLMTEVRHFNFQQYGPIQRLLFTG